MSRLLVVEDDPSMSAVIEDALASMGHEVEAVATAELGLEAARARPPALVLLDIHLPGRSGLEALPELLALRPRPTVAILTAHATAENAIEALARGAAAHVEKPVDPDVLQELVTRLLADAAPPPRPSLVRPAAPGGSTVDDGVPRLVGRSRALLDLARRIGAVARADVTVLVRGESGTGKELVARAIHAASARARAPFVAVNCAALPEALFEAELFGHERGSFTGAVKAHTGRAERAHGGTLFLDEVAELTPGAQAKLLRFLEDRAVERVGGEAARVLDLRVIAASNAPLEARVEAGTFREDLYYRLEVATLDVPPLRARLDDIPPLVGHLLARAGRPEVVVDEDALAALAARPWPGNVRELKHCLDAALVAVGPGKLLRAEQLPPPRASLRDAGPAPAPARPPEASSPEAALASALEGVVRQALARGPGGPELFERVRAEVERGLIAAALEATGGNQVATAKLLDMNRATLRRKMAAHGLR